MLLQNVLNEKGNSQFNQYFRNEKNNEREIKNNLSNNAFNSLQYIKDLPNLNNDFNKKNQTDKTFDFIYFSKKINKFPYIGFFDYYFPCLIPRKDKNYKNRLILPKILKFFSKEILQKFDLLYYLKLVRTIELLKNTSLRKKVKKENLQFLLKSLYFLRDCDFEHIIRIIDKKNAK